MLSAISPNERLQYGLHPWTGYVIVPLFALANAGVHLTGGLLSDAVSSPITLGILIGYVVGKPFGNRGRLVARHTAGAARAAFAAEPTLARGRGSLRGDRLHGVPADLEPRLHRAGGSTRRSSARSPRCCSRRSLTWVVLRVVRRLPAIGARAADRGHR